MLDLSVKKLTLLLAYLSFFVVVASAVRPAEVPAFLKYMLGLAVICAICVIWEYRTGYNVFYDLTTRALPGVFQAPLYASTFDELGRRAVVGPTELGLEVVAILSMAFPIAIVGIMHAKRWRGRILYGLAVCILGLAMLSTYRKSALLAPVTVGLALAYFRPRQALKLAPLAAVVIAVMAIAGFSAFQSVTGQFETDRLDVGTVNDRVADYDAVRPDFLSHPALGQGFGSYENFNAPADNRILDSELLLRVVETGIIGLAVFLLVIGTVIVVAAGILRKGDPAASASGARDRACGRRLPLLHLAVRRVVVPARGLRLLDPRGPVGGTRALRGRGDAERPPRRRARNPRPVRAPRGHRGGRAPASEDGRLDDVRDRRTGPTSRHPRGGGAAGADVRAARAPGPGCARDPPRRQRGAWDPAAAGDRPRHR